MPEYRCPRCNRPLLASPLKNVDLGAMSVCSHCLAFLERMAGGSVRSLMPGDLERLDEDLRWQLLRARAEYRAQAQQLQQAQQ